MSKTLFLTLVLGNDVLYFLPLLFFLLCAVRAYKNAHCTQVNMVIWLFSQGWRYVIIRNRSMMRRLNRFLAQGEGDFSKMFQKIQMAGGLPREGGMWKLGCDWLHYQLAWYTTRFFFFHFPTITNFLEIKPFFFVSLTILLFLESEWAMSQ